MDANVKKIENLGKYVDKGEGALRIGDFCGSHVCMVPNRTNSYCIGLEGTAEGSSL